MHPSLLQIKDFTYDLPDEKIARYPLPNRDSSRLLIYRNGYITEDTYRHIDHHIHEEALLVFNQTKVIHARLWFRKDTGGKIEVFCLEPDDRYRDVQTAMLQKGEVYWKCMVGGAAKWKDNQVLQLVEDANTASFHMTAAIAEKKEGYFVLRLNWNSGATFAEALQVVGKVPLPPYLNREAEQNDAHRYQTIFAKEEGSVAAPTAALHFTQQVMEQLYCKKVETGFVTLHVGAGTFKPVKSATMQDHDMHAEWIEVTPGLLETVIAKLKAKLPVIAVGTTSARSLESFYWIGVRLHNGENIQFNGIAVPQWYPYDHAECIDAVTSFEVLLQYMKEHGISKLITRTQIIIAPGYSFKIISGLITNFHQPQSTLLLLVSAMVGDDWRTIYDYALQNDFRFLSYGDGCLLWLNNAY